MLTEYELIIIGPDDFGEVITFKSSAIFNDFNDIVTEAIRKGFIGESCRKHVRIAQGHIEHEYEYIGMGRKIKDAKRKNVKKRYSKGISIDDVGNRNRKTNYTPQVN